MTIVICLGLVAIAAAYFCVGYVAGAQSRDQEIAILKAANEIALLTNRINSL
jgi:hypothetical protein